MTTSCLFLKPQVTTAKDQSNQIKDIKNFIVPAIKQAGLVAMGDLNDGLEVSDISDDVIKKIYKADVLIIDANNYETNGVLLLSPYLYYYMAIGHSRGNATILVANTTAHLPHNLIRHHTLTYSLEKIWEFITLFAFVVDEIRQRQNEDNPDNPIQHYLHLEELARARQRIAEMEADKAQQRQTAEGVDANKGRQKIIFRKVEQ